MTASLLRSRSKERITTFWRELVLSCAFSRGSWASASLRILASICCSSPDFHLKAKERMSADSLSETATNVLVPEVITGSLVRGTGKPSAGGWVEGGGEGCGVDAGSGWVGERRRSTG